MEKKNILKVLDRIKILLKKEKKTLGHNWVIFFVFSMKALSVSTTLYKMECILLKN